MEFSKCRQKKGKTHDEEDVTGRDRLKQAWIVAYMVHLTVIPLRDEASLQSSRHMLSDIGAHRSSFIGQLSFTAPAHIVLLAVPLRETSAVVAVDTH